MPKLTFNKDEILEEGKSKVNKSGYAYVGRKYQGTEITWIKLRGDKKQGDNNVNK